jgi:hypothetical protein
MILKKVLFKTAGFGRFKMYRRKVKGSILKFKNRKHRYIEPDYLKIFELSNLEYMKKEEINRY